MNVPYRPEVLEPGDYLRAIARRWWIVLGLLIVGGLVAAAYVKVAPKVYSSAASVYVTATGGVGNQVAGGRTSGAVNMDSEAQVVQSLAVATLAARLLHTTTPPETLSKQVSVTVPPNSQVLEIACHQPRASSAAACAQAFAEAYLKNRTTTAENNLKAMLSSLRDQVSALQKDVASLNSKLAALPPNSPEHATTLAALEAARAQLNSLSTQVGTLAGEMANAGGGQILSNAETPTSPTSPRKMLVLPSGLALGLILGLILAFVVDRRDKRVRDAIDVERHLDLPVLLSVPADRRGGEAGVAAPRSRAGQAYAELAHATSAALGDGNHVVLVTSSSPGAGAGVTAANLAAAFTRTHSQVVLVCADLVKSAVPALFRVSADRGLAEVLAGSATVGEAMQRPADFPRLRILPPGKDPSVLVNDFQHDVTQRLISELRRSTPVVIIEVPPASEDGDAFAMAEFADAALVVVEVGKTRWTQTEDCVKRLDRLRTMVLGAVLIPPASAPGRGRPVIRQVEAGARPGTGARGEPAAPAAPVGPSSDRSGKQPSGMSWMWEESADKGARG
jgi:Mrp family chromosome partitioning ATPase